MTLASHIKNEPDLFSRNFYKRTIGRESGRVLLGAGAGDLGKGLEGKKRGEMADDSRKGVAGSAPSAAYLRASSDDRKPPATAAGTGAAARKITFKSADMKEEMRQEVFECARVAFEKYTVEKDIAEYIKKEFDKNHGPTWHCIVGRNFGSYVTHETNHFIYFYVDSKAVLLFKSG